MSVVQEQHALLSSPFFQSLPHDEDKLCSLRAAAVATELWLHIFDMDATPPVCHVLPPWSRTFKVKGSFVQNNGSKKAVNIAGSAWSPILGKDVLPKELQFSDMYHRSKMAVLLKSEGIHHSCVLQSGQQQLPASELNRMAITFVKIEYVEGKQPKQPRQAPATGKKRGRPGKLSFSSYDIDLLKRAACFCFCSQRVNIIV